MKDGKEVKDVRDVRERREINLIRGNFYQSIKQESDL